MRYGNSIDNWSKEEINDIIDFFTATTTDIQLNENSKKILKK